MSIVISRADAVKAAVGLIFFVFLAFIPAGRVGAAIVFTTVDVPGAISTVAQDINAEGDIVGMYTLPGGAMHGFLFSDGAFTDIDYPGATMTHAYGIDSRGNIVGEYRDSANVWHGFLFACGNFTPINYPGAVTTSAWGINYRSTITGTYKDVNNRIHAFTLDRNGIYATLSLPFKVPQTQAHGVNANGDVVGCWWDSAGRMHSVIFSGGESLTNNYPGSIMSMNWRINTAGWIVGHYVDGANVTHGYLTKKGTSVFTSLDYPGANLTEPHGINNSNQMVGRYRDAANIVHGFLASPE